MQKTAPPAHAGDFMRATQYYLVTLKEAPQEAELASH
jgi:hypothetical protein